MSPSRNLLSRGTDGSNPASSSGESSANLTFGGRISRWRVPAGRGRRPDRGRDHLGTRTRGRQPKADDNLRRRRCRPEGRPEADHELVLGAFFRCECRVPRAAFGFAASVECCRWRGAGRGETRRWARDQLSASRPLSACRAAFNASVVSLLGTSGAASIKLPGLIASVHRAFSGLGAVRVYARARTTVDGCPDQATGASGLWCAI